MSDKSELASLVLKFLEHLEVERQVSQLTIRNYAHYLSRFERWLTRKNTLITDMNLAHVSQYRLFLSRFESQDGKSLARSTQSYHIIALRSFLKWLIKNDCEVLAPEKIDLPKSESKSLKFLNQDQIERLLTAPSISDLRGKRDKAILELLFSTGLRVSELVKLNRDSIDFKRKEFSVIGKGRRARVVFLSDSASYWLKKYLNERDDDWKAVFCSHGKIQDPKHSKGERMRLSVRTVQRIVKTYCKKAQLAVTISPHGLRHTFATDLLSHGAGLREVQEMLGHKNIATTQIYTHVTNPQLKKVHQKYHSGNKD